MATESRTRRIYDPESCQSCQLVTFTLVDGRIVSNQVRVNIYNLGGGCPDCVFQFSFLETGPWLNYSDLPDTADGLGKVFTLPGDADEFADYDFTLYGRCRDNEAETINSQPFSVPDPAASAILDIDFQGASNFTITVGSTNYTSDQSNLSVPVGTNIRVIFTSGEGDIVFYQDGGIAYANYGATGETNLSIDTADAEYNLVVSGNV